MLSTMLVEVFALPGPTILVVDDDRRVLELVSTCLSQAGYNLITATDGETGLMEYRRHRPNLVILDVMMPGMDGWDVCRRIRQESDTPVIMLTAKDDEFDKVLGLELGADDYITKPFGLRELVARVKAVLRRAGSSNAMSKTRRLEWPDLIIDPLSREVRARGELVKLAPKEFDLLFHMARHPGQVFTREQLYDSVWGYDYYGGVRTVDVHITRLRNKIEKDPKQPKYLITVWGVGYKFEVPEDV